MATKDDFVALLAACEAAQQAGVPWWQVGRAAARLGSGAALLDEPWEPIDRWEHDVAVAFAHHLTPEARAHWREEFERWQASDTGLGFLTILDEEYPTNLRVVFNPPPFLVMRGALVPEDTRGVAVVGTRSPSADGLRRAHCLGHELGEAGITIFSGLAAGIDAAAHSGALEAGGRTVAVLGHGLLQPVYPKENRALADAIAAKGALLSQFRPNTPPTQATFPMRNVVTSGLSQGTIVVEASRTSGARMQARLAAEQGKRVWLLRSLVDECDWARDFAGRRPDDVRVAATVNDILSEVVDTEAVAAAAAKGLPPVASAETARRGEPQQPQFALF